MTAPTPYVYLSQKDIPQEGSSILVIPRIRSSIQNESDRFFYEVPGATVNIKNTTVSLTKRYFI